MGNIMSYNSDHLNQTNNKIGQASAKAGSAQSLAGSGFTGMGSLFGNGIGEISKELGALQGSLSNVQGIMTRQTEAMFNMDNSLAKIAEVIEVPQDFVKNENNRFTQYHDMLLEKLDGKTVNEGNETDVKENMAESGVEERDLTNITTSGGADEQVYDERVSIDRMKGMSNIDKAGGTDVQEIDSRSGIASEETMRNINTAGGAEEQKLDENTVVQEKQLGSVNNRLDLQEQELNSASRIASEETLRDMSGPGGVDVQNLEEITGALQDLGDISGGSKGVRVAGSIADSIPLQSNEAGVVDNVGDVLEETVSTELGE